MFKNLTNLPTFKSLPQAIGLPFLSTQEDAQLKFKSGDNGIKRLYAEQVIPLSDVEYWRQYYRIFSSTNDVYSLITAQDVRQAIQQNPVNLSNLITHLSRHLFNLLPSSDFPSTGSSGSDQGTKDVLNCLRVLGRLLVVIYENDSEKKEFGIVEPSFAETYLWSREKMSSVETDSDGRGIQSQVEEATQFEIGEDEDNEDEQEENEISAGVRAFKATIASPNPPSTDQLEDPLSAAAKQRENADLDEQEQDQAEDVQAPCLVDRLFSCTIDLLFCAGFTVHDSVRSGDRSDEKINYVIWEKGVGSTVSIGSSGELDRNKTEVLRFLLILLSTTIYTPPHTLSATANIPLQNLTHSLERRLVLSLLCSLLNTSLTATKGSNGLAAGMTSLPYNHLISKSAEERRTLVRGCLMVLLVALDYRAPVHEAGIEMGEGKEDNAFRYFISKLHRKEDFSFVLNGITGIVQEHLAVQNGYLPGSKKPVPYILETFMLLWRVVDLNKRFRAYLFDSGRAPDIIAYILLISLEHKDDPAHHGLLRLLAYLLQTLSADQAFANALNQTLRTSVPAKWAVSGTLADFMIVSIYSIATTPGLNPLFPALTISIANAAPYLQNVGVQASTRLLQLLKAFSAPNFLLSDEGHPRLVYYLLETFNSVLYHQLNNNPNLVYAILRSHQDFQTLATFTLVSGLREIQRRKALKSAAFDAAKRDDARGGIKRTDSELEMLAEKAALLGRDGQDDEDEPSPPDLPPKSQDDHSNPLPNDLTSTDSALRAIVQSPTSEPPDPMGKPVPALPMSEKARGKMRAQSISSIGTQQALDDGLPDDEVMKIAEAGVGPNGYVPTQEWVTSWQKGLPLDPVLVAISELLPRIQDSQSRTSPNPSPKVLSLLKEISLTDVLPPTPPIVPRRFLWSNASEVWLTSLLWGDIYVAGLTSVGSWKDTTVKLFGVRQAVDKSRGAQMGRVLKRWGVV